MTDCTDKQASKQAQCHCHPALKQVLEGGDMGAIAATMRELRVSRLEVRWERWVGVRQESCFALRGVLGRARAGAGAGAGAERHALPSPCLPLTASKPPRASASRGCLCPLPLGVASPERLR